MMLSRQGRLALPPCYLDLPLPESISPSFIPFSGVPYCAPGKKGLRSRGKGEDGKGRGPKLWDRWDRLHTGRPPHFSTRRKEYARKIPASTDPGLEGGSRPARRREGRENSA